MYTLLCQRKYLPSYWLSKVDHCVCSTLPLYRAPLEGLFLVIVSGVIVLFWLFQKLQQIAKLKEQQTSGKELEVNQVGARTYPDRHGLC